LLPCAVWSIYIPAVDDDWREKRLKVLTTVAPVAAKFLLPSQRQFISKLATTGAQSKRNVELRAKLDIVAGLFNSN
jgi:hypothetical protein